MLSNYHLGLIIIILCGAIVGYLSGSILFALVIEKFIHSDKIKKFGSGNPGFTNTYRIYGKKVSLTVLALDLLKTILPVLIFWAIYISCFKTSFDEEVTKYYNPGIFIYVPGIFAFVGHLFPIYFKFKGGKGVACIGGIYICISPFIALIGIIILVIIIKWKKMMSLAVLIACIILPWLVFVPGISFNYLIYPNIIDSVRANIYSPTIFAELFGILILMSITIFARHTKNIKNIINKRENKIKSV